MAKAKHRLFKTHSLAPRAVFIPRRKRPDRAVKFFTRRKLNVSLSRRRRDVAVVSDERDDIKGKRDLLDLTESSLVAFSRRKRFRKKLSARNNVIGGEIIPCISGVKQNPFSTIGLDALTHFLHVGEPLVYIRRRLSARPVAPLTHKRHFVLFWIPREL